MGRTFGAGQVAVQSHAGDRLRYDIDVREAQNPVPPQAQKEIQLYHEKIIQLNQILSTHHPRILLKNIEALKTSGVKLSGPKAEI